MGQFFCVELLIGKDKAAKVRRGSATVIGLGAVGSYVVEGLARAGVSRLRLVDFDKIKTSNLNRHPWALHSTIGKTKASLGLKRVMDINPLCKAEAMEIFACGDNLDSILGDSSDIVIDAIDSLNPKFQLLSACYKKGLKVISSMGAATRLDSSFIKVADIFDTTHCPLAKRLRTRLKKEGVGRGIMCVYSSERRNLSAIDFSPLIQEDDYPRGRKRAKLGSLPTITGIFGLTIANYAIDYLAGGFKDIIDK